MQFHPFPESVAPFVAALSERYKARCAAGRTIDQDPQANVPAYRLPDGTVRPAYDPYRPAYPEGAEPGIADVTYSKLYGPAGHFDGYQPAPSNFRPL